MNSRSTNVVFREAIIILGVLLLSFLFGRIGRINLELPFGKINLDNVPKYSVASKDSSTVIFDNNCIFLFKRAPTNEEIINAYTGKNRSLVSKFLYPMDTYKDFWIFHLNPTFGFIGIDFDRLGHWLFFLVYPLYWGVRVVVWLIKAFKEVL